MASRRSFQLFNCAAGLLREEAAFDGERPRQIHHRALRGLVGDVGIDAAREAHDRGDVDDAAAIALEHVAGGGARAEEGAGGVDRHDALPIRQRQLDRRLADGDAGAVDEHIEAAVMLEDVGEDAVDFRRVGDVERMRLGLAGGSGDFRGTLGAGLGVAVEHRDAGADTGEGEGDGAADAAGAAGDERDLAVEAEGGERVGEIEAFAHGITSLNGRNSTAEPAATRLTPSPSSTSPSDSIMDVRIPAPSRGNFSAVQPPAAPRTSRARTYSQRLARFL